MTEATKAGPHMETNERKAIVAASWTNTSFVSITQRITTAHNSTFYRHVIRTAQPGSFFFTPIILIANTDAHEFEQLLIRSLHNKALNDPLSFQKRIPSITSTHKLATARNTKRRTQKRRRQTKAQQAKRATQTSTKPRKTPTFAPITPQLFRVHKQQHFYYRLSSLLCDNINKVISDIFIIGI